jgi:hypothetical protein
MDLSLEFRPHVHGRKYLNKYKDMLSEDGAQPKCITKDLRIRFGLVFPNQT